MDEEMGDGDITGEFCRARSIVVTTIYVIGCGLDVAFDSMLV